MIDLSLDALPSPRSLPWLGNAHQLNPSQIHSTLESWARVHGDLYTFTLAGQRFLVVAREDAVRESLHARPYSFRRLARIESVIDELGIAGVFSAEGEDWRRQRRLMPFAFSPRFLESCLPAFHRITGRLRARLEAEAGPRDVLRDLTRFIVDITVEVVFGRDVNTLERGEDEFQRNVGRIFAGVNRRVLAPFPYWRWIAGPADRALAASLRWVTGEMVTLIREAQAGIEVEPGRSERPRTLLEAMIAARDEENPGRRLSEKEIMGNIMTLMLAGEDTTANAMAWMLHAMAADRGVAGRMRKEAEAVLGPEGDISSLDQAHRLHYISAVIQETLRLRSPAPMLYLETLEPCVLAGVALPPATPVIVLTRHAQTPPEGLETAGLFQPERWLAPGGGLLPAANRSLAFGAGPRICPGRPLALLECALVASMVARSFDLHLVDGDPVRERFHFVMKPEGLRLGLVPRRSPLPTGKEIG